MKYITLIFVVICLFSCKKSSDADTEQKTYTIEPIFDTILMDNAVEGTILIFDTKRNIYFTNDSSKINEGYLPASTFKIPNSIIALEEGVADVDRVFKWDGKEKYLKNWEQDLDLKQAFSYSCVPCYQQLAREIGVDRMNASLTTLAYPVMDINDENIDTFWLTGQSRISPKEQVDFLIRLNQNELPIKNETYATLKEMMLLIEDEQTGKLYGKTGLSVQNEQRNGWFVGFVETSNNAYYFASQINQTQDIDNEKFQRIRIPITLLALEELDLEFMTDALK